MRALFIVILFLISLQVRSQVVDSLPSDPCPPVVGEPKIKLYPVPTTGKLRIDMGSCVEVNNKVLVFDMLGKLVAIYNVPGSVIDLNLSHLSRGAYYLRIINKNRTSTHGILME